ncbi:MAG: hypothetical protein LQ337_006913 [Flavoplaca oasis]|nr:MAG: hypothetical protein LQ337_006913 [Flavoplaca oasis]
MPSIRPRLPTIISVEDTRTPPPVQRVFPHRRHSSNPKASKSLPPIDKRQHTLTQIVPSLAHLSSSFGSFDGSDDLEFDTGYIMPAKKKRRRSKPAPQKQTITQMDPFRPQFPSDDGHLQSDDEHRSPPQQCKKRKSISSTPIARTVPTRSAKKKAEAGIQKALGISPTKEGNNFPDVHIHRVSPLPESHDVTMPPPKTPRTVRRKVIPSSQSPADTPISTCKRRFRTCQDITPLKERSVNTPSKSWLSPRRINIQKIPRLEVADSTDVENDDSQSLFPLFLQKHPTTFEETPPPRPKPVQSEPHPKISPSPPLADNNKTATSLHSPPPEQSFQISKSDNPLTDSDVEAKDSATQIFRKAINETIIPSSMAAGSVERFPNALVTSQTNYQDPESVGPVTRSCDDGINDNDSFETVPTQLVLQPTPQPKLQPSPTEDLQEIHNASLSFVADGRETKIHHKAVQSSSPIRFQRGPVLETESQFENAWRDYTPPMESDGNSSNGAGGSLTVISPAHEPSLPLFDQRTNTDSSTNIQSLPPIPPSQATTVDQTQASTKHTPSHPTPAPSTTVNVPLSPPNQRQAFSPSSPLHTRKSRAADTYMGYQGWNGVPMTESQLLPDSLLNDDVGLPPVPCMEEEMELYMERY